MDDHVAEVHHQPAVLGFAFDAAFSLLFAFERLHYRFGERVQHAVAGAGAKHEVVGEGGDILEVDQEDVFAFFVFKRGYDGTGKVECVQ